MIKRSLLEISGLSKHFDGLTVLFNIDVTIEAGMIVGLIGPNGAGKTTLFNIISGLYHPDQGSILFEGKNIVGINTHRLAFLGIGRTFQIPRPFLNMTVYENVYLSVIFSRTHKGRKSSDARSKVEEVLERMGLRQKAMSLAWQLTEVDKKMLEIARALGTSPKLLLLDEQISGLSSAETETATSLIRQLRDDLGVTVFWIEHVMKAVMGMSDHVIVLDYGEKICEGPPSHVAKDEKTIQAYLGAGAFHNYE